MTSEEPDTTGDPAGSNDSDGTDGTDGTDDTNGTDGRNTSAIILGVVLVVLVGAILGFVISGGLSDDPGGGGATSTTSGATSTSAAGVTTTSASVVTTSTEDASSEPSTTVSNAPPLTNTEGQLIIPAIEDTYIEVDEPDEINGAEDLLEVENASPEISQVLVRFDVPPFPEGETLASTTMRLTLASPQTAAVDMHEVIGAWSEAETSASNAPILGDLITTFDPPSADAVFVEVDLTDVISEPGSFSFYLILTTDDSSANFSSRESGAGVPVLILAWAE